MTANALWVTRVQAAELCGLSERHFDSTIRPRLPEDGFRGAGKTLRFLGSSVVAALVAYRLEQAKPAADLDSDPLLAGGDSPWLEEYRKTKTLMLRKDLAERDGEMVRVTLLNSAIRPAIAALRSTGDRLVRQYGNEAGSIFNEGVAEFEEAAQRTILKNQRDADDADPDK